MKLDILAFGAHPDDVELTCGGTLVKVVRKGASVGIIPLTRGEMGTRGSEELRAKEFENAAKIIGAKVYHPLDLPDSYLTVEKNAKLKVIREIRKYQPTLILLPHWDDRHPDHGNASRIYYMLTLDFEPDFVMDISDEMDTKKEAILAYHSQVHNKSYLRTDEEETFISSPQFMEMLITRASYYGHRIGKKFGEPFKIKTTLEIKDLLDTFGDRVY